MNHPPQPPPQAYSMLPKPLPAHVSDPGSVAEHGAFVSSFLVNWFARLLERQQRAEDAGGLPVARFLQVASDAADELRRACERGVRWVRSGDGTLDTSAMDQLRNVVWDFFRHARRLRDGEPEPTKCCVCSDPPLSGVNFCAAHGGVGLQTARYTAAMIEHALGYDMAAPHAAIPCDWAADTPSGRAVFCSDPAVVIVDDPRTARRLSRCAAHAEDVVHALAVTQTTGRATPVAQADPGSPFNDAKCMHCGYDESRHNTTADGATPIGACPYAVAPLGYSLATTYAVDAPSWWLTGGTKCAADSAPCEKSAQPNSALCGDDHRCARCGTAPGPSGVYREGRWWHPDCHKCNTAGMLPGPLCQSRNSIDGSSCVEREGHEGNHNNPAGNWTDAGAWPPHLYPPPAEPVDFSQPVVMPALPTPQAHTGDGQPCKAPFPLTGIPCVLDAGHDDDHRTEWGSTWGADDAAGATPGEPPAQAQPELTADGEPACPIRVDVDGKSLPCTLAAGHDGYHRNSAARRGWAPGVTEATAPDPLCPSWHSESLRGERLRCDLPVGHKGAHVNRGRDINEHTEWPADPADDAPDDAPDDGYTGPDIVKTPCHGCGEPVCAPMVTVRDDAEGVVQFWHQACKRNQEDAERLGPQR